MTISFRFARGIMEKALAGSTHRGSRLAENTLDRVEGQLDHDLAGVGGGQRYGLDKIHTQAFKTMTWFM